MPPGRRPQSPALPVLPPLPWPLSFRPHRRIWASAEAEGEGGAAEDGARPGYDEEEGRRGRGGGWSEAGARPRVERGKARGEEKGRRGQGGAAAGAGWYAARREKGQKIQGMQHTFTLRSLCRTGCGIWRRNSSLWICILKMEIVFQLLLEIV
jgi:hypothetical protein